jgi:hypothetical protein
MSRLKIDYRAADMITVANLKRYRKMLRRQLKDHTENGSWLHPDDKTNHEKVVDAITLIVEHYGEY